MQLIITVRSHYSSHYLGSWWMHDHRLKIITWSHCGIVQVQSRFGNNHLEMRLLLSFLFKLYGGIIEKYFTLFFYIEQIEKSSILESEIFSYRKWAARFWQRTEDFLKSPCFFNCMRKYVFIKVWLCWIVCISSWTFIFYLLLLISKYLNYMSFSIVIYRIRMFWFSER